MLLRDDGTLWRYNVRWGDLESLSSLNPVQVGDDADWTELLDSWPGYVRKKDGSVWLAVAAVGVVSIVMEQATNLDQAVFQTASFRGSGEVGFVHTNGTLWIGSNAQPIGMFSPTPFTYMQSGSETNWQAVAFSDGMLIGLKTDGTLWKWTLPHARAADAVYAQPVRLGIHNDWVALTARYGGVLALAADGSVWLWPDWNYFRQNTLLQHPKQPKFIGNVFEARN